MLQLVYSTAAQELFQAIDLGARSSSLVSGTNKATNHNDLNDKTLTPSNEFIVATPTAENYRCYAAVLHGTRDGCMDTKTSYINEMRRQFRMSDEVENRFVPMSWLSGQKVEGNLRKVSTQIASHASTVSLIDGAMSSLHLSCVKVVRS